MEHRARNRGQIMKSGTADTHDAIPRDIIQSKNLSLEEKGLLIYLLSMPPNWVIYKQQLQEATNTGRRVIDRIFASLQEKGYIISVKMHNPDGTFGWNHVVYQEPHFPKILRSGATEPACVSPGSRNAQL